MREHYHERLEALLAELVEMAEMVGAAIGRSTSALLESDLRVAESVIAGDDDVDARAASIEDSSLELLALQAPVANELRIVVGALRMSTTLERMGDLAVHVAKVARLRYPEPVVPERLRPTFREMGDLAVELSMNTAEIIKNRDVAEALRLDAKDDRMDELNRRLLQQLLAPDWAFGVEPAVDLALLSRFYERFADHAVSIANRMVHLVTGEYAESG